MTPERCIACDEPFKDGDLVFWEISGGELHAACCGPERESFVNQAGEPLASDEPLPQPYAWRADDADTDQ